MPKDVMNRIAAYVFIVGLAVGTLWLASTAEAQTAGAASAMLPDVVGFRPGMTLPEAYAKLKAYFPNGTVEIFDDVTIPEISSKKLPYLLRASQFGVSESPEVLEAGIVLPPSPQLVWEVLRQLNSFPPKEDMSRTALMNALVQKYGKPDRQQMSDSEASMVWLFDVEGRRETENTPPASPCVAAAVPVNQGAIGILKDPSPTFPQDSTHGWLRCKNMVYVRASMARDSTKPSPEYVNRFIVTVGNGQLATLGADATVGAINAAHGQQQKQDLDKVKQQAAPKL